jgi:hypothetical protein
MPESRGTVEAKLGAVAIASGIGALAGLLIGLFIDHDQAWKEMLGGAAGAGGIIGGILFFLDNRPKA